MTLPSLFDSIARANSWTFSTEFKFHPTRKWRFDRADVGNRIAIEFDGGVWIKGRHTRGSGFVRDCEKFNEAAALGWRILRYTSARDLAEFPRQYKECINSTEKV